MVPRPGSSLPAAPSFDAPPEPAGRPASHTVPARTLRGAELHPARLRPEASADRARAPLQASRRRGPRPGRWGARSAWHDAAAGSRRAAPFPGQCAAGGIATRHRGDGQGVEGARAPGCGRTGCAAACRTVLAAGRAASAPGDRFRGSGPDRTGERAPSTSGCAAAPIDRVFGRLEQGTLASRPRAKPSNGGRRRPPHRDAAPAP